MTAKEIAQKYSVILEINSNSIKINLVSNDTHGSRFFIKDDLSSFSISQKRVLSNIRNFDGFKTEINWEYFFKNLKKSNFSIYQKKSKKIEKIYFNTEGEKIDIRFIKAEDKNFFPIMENDFVVKAHNKKSDLFFTNMITLEKNIVFFLDENKINIIKLSDIEFTIIKRIHEKQYDKNSGFFSQNFETKLSEDEILSINTIIKNFSKNFNLITTLKSNFNVVEYNKEKEEIQINFNSIKKTLDVKIILNYGFKKIDISKTVYKNTQSNRVDFIRRVNSQYGFKYIFKIDKNNIKYTKINYDREVDMYKFFLSFYKEFGFTQNITLNKKGDKNIKSFLNMNFEKLNNIKERKIKIIYTKHKLKATVLDFKADIELSKTTTDWLSFNGNFYLGKDQVSLDQLQKYSESKSDYITDINGEMIEIKNRKEMDRLLSILKNFKENNETGKLEGNLYGSELEDIFTSSSYYNAKFNNGFKNFISEAKSGKPVKKIKLSKKNSNILRDYQEDGIDWMYFLKKYNFGGILADDMGLGKTIQTLIMLEINKVKNKPSIVIVPKTLIGNWESEAKKFTKNLKILVVEGSLKERELLMKNAKEYDLIITSYSFFQRDYFSYKEKSISFNYAVLDEAQYIKNFKTKNAQIVKKIDANYRLALTGTPLENSVSEIWSIFEFLMPGFLGTQANFTKKYLIPISKDGDNKKMVDLKNKISIFMLRRTKKTVLKELPEKTIQTIMPALSPDQSILYQEILSKIKSDMFGKLKRRFWKKLYEYFGSDDKASSGL